MDGWIKLHRKFIKWEWYDDINTKVLFLHLLLTANHEQKQWHGVTINRGQVLVGRKKLSKNIGLSEQQTRTSINKLKSTNEITTKSTNKYTIITIVNWDEYQKQTKNQPAKQPSKQLTSNQQVTTTKNDKNIKNTTFKDGDTLILNDGLRVKRYFGNWVVADNKNVRVDERFYPELK